LNKIDNLPNFIIAGERRCGTTSLSRTLGQHPDIFLHPKQDKAWFVDDTVRSHDSANSRPWEDTHDISQYAAWFADGGYDTETARGEKSADYLFWRPSHARLLKHLPDAKIIIILRNPTERAWSHYWNEVAKGRERLTFETALAAEPDRSSASDYGRYSSSYLARGEYDQSIAGLLSTLPRARLLVTTIETLKNDPNVTLRKICRFLSVDEDFDFSSSNQPRNVNWAVHPKPWVQARGAQGLAAAYRVLVKTFTKTVIRDRNARRKALVKFLSPFYLPAASLKMAANTQRDLDDHFRPHISALEEILDQSFHEWRRK